MKKVFTTIIATLIAIATIDTTVSISYADYPNPSRYGAVLKEAVPDKYETAELSSWSIMDSQESTNKLLCEDGYYSVLLGVYNAARNETFDLLDEGTATEYRPMCKIYTSILNGKQGYSNTLLAISRDNFSKKWRKSFRGEIYEGIDVSSSIGNLNEVIEEEVGIPNAIDQIPNDPNAVLLLSIAKQKTAWQNNMKSDNLRWNRGKSVKAFSGKVTYQTAEGPNGSTIYHLHMQDGVVFSFVFKDEINVNPGEWLVESFSEAGYDSEMNFNIPELNLEQTFDFSSFEGLKFLFGYDAELYFGNTEMFLYSAKQKSKFTLDEKGCEAAAVTYAVSLSKGLTVITEEEKSFLVDRPFIFAVSYEENGILMPTFIGEINDPSVR